MANEINTSASKLTERILADARAEAEASLKEAELASAAISAEGAREGAITAQAFIKRVDEVTGAILERSRTNAELNARKQALLTRRDVLNAVFAKAYDKLCALSDSDRTSICRDMLLREAEGGEKVMPAQAEADLVAILLPDVNAELAKAGKVPLSLAQGMTSDLAHGFTLYGAGFEKDCSFLALLRDARAVEETNVSGILFD